MPMLRDIMTREIVTVGPESTLREAAETLSDAGIGGAPVVGSGRLLGVLTLTDIVEFAANAEGVPTAREGLPSMADLEYEWEEQEPRDGDDGVAGFFVDLWEDAGADLLERFRQVGGPEWNVLEEHTVDEIMSRRIAAMAPDTEVGVAAGRMLDDRVHRLLVLDGDRLVGLVSTVDFLRLVAGRAH